MASLIEERLYLGGLDCVQDKLVEALKLTHVLSVMKEFPDECLPYLSENNIEHKLLRLEDYYGQSLLEYFNEAFQFIDDAVESGGIVLVHCMAGVSRSASMVINYVMRKKGVSYIDAKYSVERKRPIVSPNYSFSWQLILWAKMGYEAEGDTEFHQFYKSFLKEDGLFDADRFIEAIEEETPEFLIDY